MTSAAASEALCIPAIRILKIASCPSLSGRSALIYHIACTRFVAEGEAPAIQVRVFANSGGGFFSNEWVELRAIQQALAKVPDGIALTAHLLSSLFLGKSANTQAFLFAVLKHEGLVSVEKDSKGRYRRADAGKFMAEVEALMASNVDLQVEEKVTNPNDTKPAIPNPPTPPAKPSSKKSPKKTSELTKTATPISHA